MANQDTLPEDEKAMAASDPAGDNPYDWPDFDGLQDEEAVDA